MIFIENKIIFQLRLKRIMNMVRGLSQTHSTAFCTNQDLYYEQIGRFHQLSVER